MSDKMSDFPVLFQIISQTIDDDDDFVLMRSTVNSCVNSLDASTNAAVALGAAVAQSSRMEQLQLHGAIRNFYEDVVPSYSLDTFQSHFRMSRSAMEVLSLISIA